MVGIVFNQPQRSDHSVTGCWDVEEERLPRAEQNRRSAGGAVTAVSGELQ